jgi:hypothetical protein
MTKDTLRGRERRRETSEDIANQKWERFFLKHMAAIDADAIEWTMPNGIIAMLGLLGREVPHYHWAFLPDGDSFQIARTGESSERDCMQIETTSGVIWVCRPVSLMCFSFPFTPEVSYFDLQLGEMRRKNKATGPGDVQEQWCGKVLTDGPSDRRADYTRLLRGRVVIFSAGLNLGDREPEHASLTREECRARMQIEADRRLVSA